MPAACGHGHRDLAAVFRRHASECRNALTRELTGYFVPIDQWRAIRALLRSSPGTTEVLARVHDLLAEFRSDQYRVLDNEPDPFRQGWRQRSVQVVEALDAAQDAAATLEDTLEDAIQQRPIAAVGLALGLGFLIGVTWRR